MELCVRLILFASILGFSASKIVPDLPPDCDLENSENEVENHDQLKIINETEIQSIMKSFEGLSGPSGSCSEVDRSNGKCGAGCSCCGRTCRCWQRIYISSLHINTYAYLTVIGYPRCRRMYVQLQYRGHIYFRGYLGALHPGTRYFRLSCYSTFTLEFYHMRVCGRHLYGCAYLRFRYRGHQYGLFALGCFHAHSLSDQELAQIQQQLPEDVSDTEAETVDDSKSFKDLSLEDVLLALKEMEIKGDENQIQNEEEEQEKILMR